MDAKLEGRLTGEFLAEMTRQYKKWGVQDHPLPVWLLVLMEEVGELAKAILEKKPMKEIEREAVQCGAVSGAIVVSIWREAHTNAKKEKKC